MLNIHPSFTKIGLNVQNTKLEQNAEFQEIIYIALEEFID